MQFLDLTLPTLAENLALDEALLDAAETSSAAGECFRLWEGAEVAVVLGRSSRRAMEANLAACELNAVPVLRRCSGGCAVVIGPGCLMYSVVLSYERRPELRSLDEAHRFVLGNVQRAIDGSQLKGTSDLVWRARKFSGNSLRCKRSHLLYHGTLLYDFPLHLIGDYLRTPPREPEYRAGRGHLQFVGNVPVAGATLRAALQESLNAIETYNVWPRELTQRLVDERYSQAAWNEER